MAHFILQTFKGMIEHDFVFHLKKAIEYHEWMYPIDPHTYSFSDTPLNLPGSYPVGDLEFVFESLSLADELNPIKKVPLNLPTPLDEFQFALRYVKRSSDPGNPFRCPAFVKSDTHYKKFNDLVFVGEKTSYEDERYFFTSEIQIDSEWRLFVHQKKIIGMNHYAGDPFAVPSRAFVENAIAHFENSPVSYTLDLGVSRGDTFVMEVHPFVSCGLYGVVNLKLLPEMFMAGVRYLKN